MDTSGSLSAADVLALTRSDDGMFGGVGRLHFIVYFCH